MIVAGGWVLKRAGVAGAIALALAAVDAAHAAPGEPDPTFGAAGVVVRGFQPRANETSSALEDVKAGQGGSIDAVGWANISDGGYWEAAAIRLTENGAFDPSFATGGLFLGIFDAERNPTWPYNLSMRAGVVLGDGSIVLDGNREIGHLTAAGQVDQSFDRSPVRIDANAMALAANGELLLAGEPESTQRGSSGPAAVERSFANGAPDPGFGSSGQATLSPGPWAHATSVVALPEGKALIAGWCTGASAGEYLAWVARLNPDGSLDTAFGASGFARVPSAGQHAALAREPSGRLVLIGEALTAEPGPAGEPHGRQPVAWGLTPGGQIDASFGNGGRTAVPASEPALTSDVNGAVSDSAGEVLIATEQITQAAITPEAALAHAAVIRLTPDGRLDSGYGHGGLATGPANSGFNSVMVDAYGRAVAVGTVGKDALVERFQGDGQPPGAPAPPGTGPHKKRAGVAPARVRMHCGRRVHRRNHRGVPIVRERCVVTIDRVQRAWSSISAKVARGAGVVARASGHRRRGKLSLHLSFSSPPRTRYHLTVTLRAHRRTKRLQRRLRSN